MKNIFDVLKESHEKQRLLLDALMETSGDSPAREEFYHNLKSELEQHAAAEERFFYAPLIESDKTIDLNMLSGLTGLENVNIKRLKIY